MPTVSVIIPTFNRRNLVLNAIRSVFGQTYQDYEIIVVDDGSTDDTADALKPYMNRIRYVQQANLGASAAQNRGVELARGKWISILASDDLWLPTKLETQLRVVSMLGSAFGACFTDCDFFGSPRSIPSAFEQAGLQKHRSFGPLKEPFKFILARHPAIYVQSLLVLRTLMKELTAFDEQLVVGEDTDLLFRLAFKTKFCFVNEALVRIDRTQSREIGLMELFAKRDDRVCSSIERRLQKWLCLPENVSPEIRQELRDRLQLLYYDWLVASLYRFRCVKAFHIARRIKATGDNNTMMYRTIAYRAKRKICSRISRFHWTFNNA